MELAALPNRVSSGQLRGCSIAYEYSLAEDMHFPTIEAKCNGPLEALDVHIAHDSSDLDGICGARGPPIYGIIRLATRL